MIRGLHEIIVDIVTADFPKLEVVRDPVCGGGTLVSLFCDKKRSV